MSSPNCIGCPDEDTKCALLLMWGDVLANPPANFEKVGQPMEWNEPMHAIVEVDVGCVYFHDYCAICTLSAPDEEGCVWACTGQNIVRLEWTEFYAL